MTKDYQETINDQSKANDVIKSEERKRIGEELWKWYWEEDGETSAHAIKRITGIDTPKPILEKDQWNPGKYRNIS